MFNIEKLMSSFCTGILGTIIMWIVAMLMVLLFSIGRSEAFTITGWIAVSAFFGATLFVQILVVILRSRTRE